MSRRYNEFHIFYEPMVGKRREINKLESFPYQLKLFEKQEDVFRRAAQMFGLDDSKGRYERKVEVWKGMRVDLSYLIIPDYIEGKDAYWKVGFHP